MNINFEKYPDSLVPTIIQDADTATVLMLGFMNEDALAKTKELQKVTFFSRSKNRLWTKGEESGNFLLLKEILVDCDEDSILIKATPSGPVCHTGADTCFNEKNINQPKGEINSLIFLQELENTIRSRKENPTDTSYTSSLFAKGRNKVAQKLGEEAVELVIEAMDNNEELFKEEAADLMYHYLVLLRERGMGLEEVVEVLRGRKT